jgi:hypothetical protein
MTASLIAQQEARGALFDAIAAAERAIAQAFAARAELVDQARRYSAATPARETGSRWDAGMVARREFVSELACTLRLPERTAENLIAESRALAEDLPATREALQNGQISYRQAQTLIGQAWTVPGNARAAFEAALLPAAANLTAAKLKHKARLLRERLHPETITARHQAQVSDRAVFFQPEADGMASLTWYDTADTLQAAYTRATDLAHSLQGPAEPRTLAQLRADALADLLIDGVTPAGLGTGIRASVNVTVPVLTLLGHSEEPGHLEGYGPIDPDTARRLAATAPSFTRLLTHPETGVVLSIGRTRYKVPKRMRQWLRVRDETCRFPGCNRAARRCDLDHSQDWQFGGPTDHDNLAHLCPGDHALKSETGWSLEHAGDGTLTWTSPTGRTFTTEPATRIRPTPAPAPQAAPAQAAPPQAESMQAESMQAESMQAEPPPF